jgi:hypothetical protein
VEQPFALFVAVRIRDELGQAAKAVEEIDSPEQRLPVA